MKTIGLTAAFFVVLASAAMGQSTGSSLPQLGQTATTLRNLPIPEELRLRWDGAGVPPQQQREQWIQLLGCTLVQGARTFFTHRSNSQLKRSIDELINKVTDLEEAVQRLR